MRDSYIRPVSFIVFIVGWYVITELGLGGFLPSPVEVALGFVSLLGSGQLLEAVSVSLQALLLGYGLAICAGIPIGLLMGSSRRFELTVDIYVNFLYVLPMTALIPIIILWQGIGLGARTVVVFLFAVFVIIINTYYGVKSIDRDIIEAARAYGTSGIKLFYKVMLPAVMPFVFAALRLGAQLAWRGSITAEIVIATVGMGDILMTYSAAWRLDLVFAGVVMIAIIGLALVTGMRMLERRFAIWWVEAPSRR